jgi:hypothetical protein
MTQGLIYMVDVKGGLPPHEAIGIGERRENAGAGASYPELITDGDGELLLFKREQSMADSDDSSGRWSVDNLFVMHDSVPVLRRIEASGRYSSTHLFVRARSAAADELGAVPCVPQCCVVPRMCRFPTSVKCCVPSLRRSKGRFPQGDRP